MNPLVIFAIALALAMDAFAVALGVGLSRARISKLQMMRLAVFFGSFQFLMTFAGWLVGKSLVRIIQAIDHWTAFVLLLLIGSKMIYESFKRKEGTSRTEGDPTKGLSLLVLSLATSIDALAVGLSFAALDVVVFYPAVVIGLMAFVMTVFGAKTGPHVGRIVGSRAEFLGGMILILIGIRILTKHL